MDAISDLLFEAKMLKNVQRTGYQFLGAGSESVAEHTFVTVFIAFVLLRLSPGADPLKTLLMALFHDLHEARMGDLNYVQKKYVEADEDKALRAGLEDVPFADEIIHAVQEFNEAATPEARIVHDADQLALVLDLKDLLDMGFKPPGRWIESVAERVNTQTGKKLVETIMNTPKDRWWHKLFVDNDDLKK